MSQLNDYLQTLGFKNEVIVALDSEGICVTTDLIDITEEDAKTIFKLLKNPGGQIPNLAFLAAGGIPGVTTRATAGTDAATGGYILEFMPAPGLHISYLSSKYFNKLV